MGVGKRCRLPVLFAPPRRQAPEGPPGVSEPVSRSLTESDLDEVARLERETLDSPWSIASLRSFLAPPRGGDATHRGAELASGVWIDGVLVGVVLAAWTGDRVDLYRLAVDPDHRRRGIARSLVARVLEGARALAAGGVDLELRADNLGAQAFYAELGFREVGRRVSYYRSVQPGGGAVDALLMSLELGDSPREPGAASR